MSISARLHPIVRGCFAILPCLLVACGGAGGDESTTGGAAALSSSDGSSDPPASDSKPKESATDDSASWDGTWEWDFTGNPGDGVFIAYVITVDGKNVTVAADGNDTSKHMTGIGSAIGGGALLVSFDSCGEDDSTECQGLGKGDLLFTLLRNGDQASIAFDKLEAPNLADSAPLERK